MFQKKENYNRAWFQYHDKAFGMQKIGKGFCFCWSAEEEGTTIAILIDVVHELVRKFGS
jgi:hypothetical protein